MLHCAMLKKIVAKVAESRTHATGLAKFSAVARYVTLGSDSCNLSRNGVARQVARKIAQCNSVLKVFQIFSTKLAIAAWTRVCVFSRTFIICALVRRILIGSSRFWHLLQLVRTIIEKIPKMEPGLWNKLSFHVFILL